MLKKDIPTGIILYEGPSLLDGKPIVVIANTFKKSANEKTGQMVQTWIMRSDMHPNDALKSGEDSSICGNCKHRGEWDAKKGRRVKHTCYVNILHGPTGVFRAYKSGKTYVRYEPYMDKFFVGHKMRLGCYGDPAAVPLEIWSHLCNDVVAGYTGYTHQWKVCNPLLARYCMASVDTIEEQKEAKDTGWRTFRVREDDDPIVLSDEIVCPASKEAGKLTSCSKCRACKGLGTTMSKNVVIKVHGWKHKLKYFKIMIQAYKLALKIAGCKNFPAPKKLISSEV